MMRLIDADNLIVQFENKNIQIHVRKVEKSLSLCTTITVEYC